MCPSRTWFRYSAGKMARRWTHVTLMARRWTHVTFADSGWGNVSCTTSFCICALHVQSSGGAKIVDLFVHVCISILSHRAPPRALSLSLLTPLRCFTFFILSVWSILFLSLFLINLVRVPHRTKTTLKNGTYKSLIYRFSQCFISFYHHFRTSSCTVPQWYSVLYAGRPVKLTLPAAFSFIIRFENGLPRSP